jgi:hypothetical protein
LFNSNQEGKNNPIYSIIHRMKKGMKRSWRKSESNQKTGNQISQLKDGDMD